MAEIEYTYGVYGSELYADEAAPQPDAPAASVQAQDRDAGSLGRTVNIAGALASLALVIGVGVWGYKLMMRDVSGVPVVRALAGPMRALPEEPGGQPADHQGLAVNAVAAGGAATPPADRLALAPRPVRLADEDVPMGDLGAVATRASLDSAAIASFRDGKVDALVEDLTRDSAPLEQPLSDKIEQPEPLAGPSTQGTQDRATMEETEIATEMAQPAVLTGPGLRRSLRPQVRPAQFETASAMGADVLAALSAAQDAVASVDVEADSVPQGARLAQLGAFDTPDLARAEWERLNTRFGDYLDDKQRVIQKASSGGRVFYRLRAMGFDDLSDARRFCSALVAENADCIPVTVR